MGNNIYILNPDYHFRNDKDRVVMYSYNNANEYSNADWLGFIHPCQAMLLALFTDARDLESHLQDISKHFHLTKEEAQDIIRPYINNQTEIYTVWKGNRVKFPKNVLIPYTDNIQMNYRFTLSDIHCDTVSLTPDRTHKSPQYMLFMLTNKCVTSCKYCYADRVTTSKEMPMEKILDIIDEAHSLKMSQVDVIGGEVFCKREWNVIIKKLVEYGMSPTFISTKIPITHDIALKLKDTGYDNLVQISLDCLDDAVLSETIGTKRGYINRLTEGIEILQDYGFKIQIDTVLTRHNSTVSNILQLYNLIKNIRNLTLWEIRVPSTSIYSSETYERVKATKSELAALCSFIRKEIQSKSPIKIVVSDEELTDRYQKCETNESYFPKGTCGILNNKFFVLPDGKVSVCEQLYNHPMFLIGDLTKQTIEEVWTSPKAKALFNFSKEMITSRSPCKKCNAIDFCMKNKRRCVVRVIQAYGNDKWDYPDPFCKYAPKFNSVFGY